MKTVELDTIFNQDCLVGLKALPDKSIDLILTDPPYGKNFDYPEFRHNQDYPEEKNIPKFQREPLKYKDLCY